MSRAEKVLILGAAGRVGAQIAAELLRESLHVVLVDIVPENPLRQLAGRLLSDARIAESSTGSATVYGAVDVLNKEAVAEILVREAPDLVINYAIPITWDATKRLPNYPQVSAAGLGAFTPIQALAPLAVGAAILEAGLDCGYMVGNLPDITIPVVSGAARQGLSVQPLCGAGNVGLNQVAMRGQIARELEVSFSEVELSLVSHHVHWVAPREPGYSDEGPFLARALVGGRDVTADLGDLRALMNRGVREHYESHAGFSSTTGILASRVALALLDNSGTKHRLHAPAPLGLPGGYPLQIGAMEVEVDLPSSWALEDAMAAMRTCHQLDGVEAITEDGTVTFTEQARHILRQELNVELPEVMGLDDIGAVATAQIETLRQLFA